MSEKTHVGGVPANSKAQIQESSSVPSENLSVTLPIHGTTTLRDQETPSISDLPLYSREARTSHRDGLPRFVGNTSGRVKAVHALMLFGLVVLATPFILMTKNVFFPGQGSSIDTQDSAEARAEARGTGAPFSSSVRPRSGGGYEGRSGNRSGYSADWQRSNSGSTDGARSGTARSPGLSPLQGTQDNRILAARSALKRSWDDEEYTPAYAPGFTPEYEQTDQPETPYHPLEQGTLTIAGTVVNEAGGPVSGIGVVAITQRLYGEQAELLDLGKNRRKRSTSTNSSGLFRFEALADGDYQIQTVAHDYYPLVVSTTVRAGVDSARLVVVEEREIWVNGFVASTEGQALPQVGIYSSLLAQPVAVSDASGSFEFPLVVRGDRGHSITFRSEGYQEQRISINRNDWGTTDRVDLDVAMRPAQALTAVSGTVQSRSGDPVAGEQIYLKRLQKKYKTTTNAAGGFVIEGVESGDNYVLWITPEGPYHQYRQEHLRVPADGLNDLAILLDPVQTASVAGWMKDNQGNPVSNFTLLARSYSSRGFAEQVTSDQTGYFEIHDVPDGRLRFESASFPRFVVSGIQLAAGSDIEIGLELDVGNQQIGGRVIDEQGNPVAGADITLSWVLRADGLVHESLRKTTSNENGTFQFTQLGTGTHSLIVGAPGFEGAKLAADPGSGAPIAGGVIEVQLREQAE